MKRRASTRANAANIERFEIKNSRDCIMNGSFIYVCAGLTVLLLRYNISKLKGNTGMPELSPQL
jgi:hypothetical protein